MLSLLVEERPLSLIFKESSIASDIYSPCPYYSRNVVYCNCLQAIVLTIQGI